MSNSPVAFIRELREAVKEAVKVIEHVSQTAQTIARLGFAAVAGALGGFTGLLISYGVHLAYPQTDLTYTSFIMFGLLFLVGVALFLGPSSLAQDRGRLRRQAEAADLLEQIRSLPRNAPAVTRDGLWMRYNALYGIEAARPTPLPTSPTVQSKGDPSDAG